MHELALANEICAIVERTIEAEHGGRMLTAVTVVAVEVGVRSNVEPDNLQFCLDALLSTPPFGRGVAQLISVAGDDLRVAWFELDEENALHEVAS